MEETYVPRREFHRKAPENQPKKYPSRRTNGSKQKKEASLGTADIILMQAIVCTLIFAVIVCIRVINTDFTVGIREKLKTAMSQQLTMDDAAKLIDNGKSKLVSLQQTVKTTFGFQDNLTPGATENETKNLSTETDIDKSNEQQYINQTEITGSPDESAVPDIINEVPVSEANQAENIKDEAVIDEEILQQISSEASETPTEKKQEPLREIMPPSEGI